MLDITTQFQSQDKAIEKTRIVVAMSGGVDSSVVSALLSQAGYDVIGVTLKLYGGGAAGERRVGACCSMGDANDARRVADKCGFPHYVLDYEDKFQKAVVDDFVNSYLKGETPVPCIRCNQKVKFQDMMHAARDMDADYLVTGHYARCIAGANGMELHRSLNDKKDQSYYLFTLTKDDLDFIRFPLGDYKDKSQIRDIAQAMQLETHNKPDSQDICFISGGKYTDFIKKITGDQAVAEGNFVHYKDGRVLGRHKGIINYTVGQRKGIGLTDPMNREDALYVVKLDNTTNTVFLGTRECLSVDTANIKDINWIGDDDISLTGGTYDILVRVRSFATPVPAVVHVTQGKEGIIHFYGHCSGIAPGQAAVFYDTEFQRVLGGGWLVSG